MFILIELLYFIVVIQFLINSVDTLSTETALFLLRTIQIQTGSLFSWKLSALLYWTNEYWTTEICKATLLQVWLLCKKVLGLYPSIGFSAQSLYFIPMHGLPPGTPTVRKHDGKDDWSLSITFKYKCAVECQCPGCSPPHAWRLLQICTHPPIPWPCNDKLWVQRIEDERMDKVPSSHPNKSQSFNIPPVYFHSKERYKTELCPSSAQLHTKYRLMEGRRGELRLLLIG